MIDLLEVRDVTKEFAVEDGLLRTVLGTRETVTAVKDVSFSIGRGETFGLVGESGAGKSTIANLVTQFYEPTSGTIVFEGTDTSYYLGQGLDEFRKSVQMVFQTPSGSIDPRYRVGDWVEESLIVHTDLSASERKTRVLELLDDVGLQEEHIDHYPHELSGGQLQRVSIASALAVEPDLILLDEPVSALDKSVQFRILKLLETIQQERGVSYLLISHDLRVIQELCDRVGVLYLGELVEKGPTDRLFREPCHPYTLSLIDSIPPRDPDSKHLITESEPPSAIDPPSGCSFHPRCPYATDRCESEAPGREQIDSERMTACHHWDELT